jgi:hypothetical protein
MLVKLGSVSVTRCLTVEHAEHTEVRLLGHLLAQRGQDDRGTRMLKRALRLNVGIGPREFRPDAFERVLLGEYRLRQRSIAPESSTLCFIVSPCFRLEWRVRKSLVATADVVPALAALNRARKLTIALEHSCCELAIAKRCFEPNVSHRDRPRGGRGFSVFCIFRHSSHCDDDVVLMIPAASDGYYNCN